MPAPISVIIPTLNASTELPKTLAHLMEGIEAGLIAELIVSDGGSQDDTTQIADGVGARVVRGPASRGGQLRRGIAQARAPWLLVLHADTHLAPGWTDPVAAHLVTSAPAYFQLRFRATGLAPAWVAGWANLRAKFFGLPYGDQGLLVPRSVYDAAGGFPDIPLMEDVALVRRLPPLTSLPVIAATGAARYEASGWMRRGTRNLWTLARYLGGARPEDLARSYQRR